MKLFALLTPLALALVIAVPAQAQTLPAGEGKEALESVCGACHGADLVMGSNQPRASWVDTVEQMKGKGAEGSDAEFAAIINYLAKYFGPLVNVNTAAEKDLKEQLGLSDGEVSTIVAARAKAKIKDYAELIGLSGIDKTKLDPIKARVKF